MTVYGATTSVYFYLKDHLGTVHALTDTNGAVVESYRFDAWGWALGVYDGSGLPIGNQQSAIGNRFLFQAREYSWATGLYFFRARYYDPVTGRWLSKDPIGISGGLNQYAFVGNNPVNRVDPLGLTWGSNISFLWDFVTGGGDTCRVYGPETVEGQEMMQSPGAQALRDAFARSGYMGVGPFEYGTGDAFVDTVLFAAVWGPFRNWGDTSAQVGGFNWATAVNNGNGTVTYTIPNWAGANSFFYHMVNDRVGTTGPFRTIYQVFVWTEPIPQSNSQVRK